MNVFVSRVLHRNFLKRLGNLLGKFVLEDPCFKNNVLRTIAKLLLDYKKESLVESMNIETRHKIHTNFIDYYNVYFRCSQCHTQGNITRDYTKPFINKVCRRRLEKNEVSF